MKKFWIFLVLLMFGLHVQGQDTTSTDSIPMPKDSLITKKFSGYVEQLNIFNLGSTRGKLYSTGVNASFGREFKNRLYAGGGISMYYLTEFLYLHVPYPSNVQKYNSNFAMDFFADIKYRILPTKITPTVGFKLGVGFMERSVEQKIYPNFVMRLSVGCLFKLQGRHELMLNVERIPAFVADLNGGIALNLGYKF